MENREILERKNLNMNNSDFVYKTVCTYIFIRTVHNLIKILPNIYSNNNTPLSSYLSNKIRKYLLWEWSERNGDQI